MERVAVLASGGLDSSVLLAEMAGTMQVYPLYIRAGLAWEAAEQRALEAFLARLSSANVRPVTVLTVQMQPFYEGHWSLTGNGVPDAETAGTAVFLPGRNLVLLSLAAAWCSTHGVSRIAIGTLWGSPFPDASPHFFEEFGRVSSLGLAHQITVVAPFRGLGKEELIRRHSHLPLELTVTCMAAQGGVHCGACNKCRERQRAFARAGVADRARYVEQREPV